MSIESEHFNKNSVVGEAWWMKIEDFGHTLSGMRAFAPVDYLPANPDKDAPCLEYQMFLFSKGTFELTAIFSPTLNFIENRGLHYAISFDDQQPQIVTLVPANYDARNGNSDWENSVSNNARISLTSHSLSTSGYHTLKVWMIDPGVVLQKLILNTGNLKNSYLGPPESYRAQ